jgi:antitoxin component of RelBE/YafQ-DinJ toxin-antitoxin module
MYVNKEDEKTEVIRLRVTKKLKEDFMRRCDSRAINASKLLRHWLEKYTYDNDK